MGLAGVTKAACRTDQMDVVEIDSNAFQDRSN
jgi:hypothetical protein